MINPKLFARLLHINWVLVSHGLDEMAQKIHLFRPVRYLAKVNSGWTARREAPVGQRVRLALEDLGPIFVKFGQALSTRKDLLPEDIANELVKLQDKVPPFSVTEARQLIEAELGSSIKDVFSEFDNEVLASASVAQVHAATLKTGEDVVVKVLRPDIEQRIRIDIGLLYEIAKLAAKFWPEAKRLRPVEVVAEFEKTILDELDLIREAGNAAKLRRNFEQSEVLYIPKIYWPYTRTKVLVMERVYGIPVGDIESLEAAGVDFKVLAERGVEIFFTQVFRDNFFHADMHPGNIFVTTPAKYIAIDFGIVGTLSLSDQRYLAENFLAFFNRDYYRVAEMHVASGWVPNTTRIEEFESAIRTVCEPIFEKPLKEISFGLFLLRLFETARRFDMEVQPQLVLLQKTLLNIEGLGRELYPDLDLWQTAKPFLEDWFKERLSPKAKLTKVIDKMPLMAEQLPEIPALAFRVLDDAAKGKLHVNLTAKDLASIRNHLVDNQRRIVSSVIGATFVLVATMLGLADYIVLSNSDESSLWPWFLAAVGGFFFIRANQHS
ncbi:MAG: ubiquinone biosynthesis regulatory protein kinase UbiB [Methylococcales bacterium]|nr:ubiquinone biosynthesis regulatory protein kinase UbiB [Methylococcales bacterium]